MGKGEEPSATKGRGPLETRNDFAVYACLGGSVRTTSIKKSRRGPVGCCFPSGSQRGWNQRVHSPAASGQESFPGRTPCRRGDFGTRRTEVGAIPEARSGACRVRGRQAPGTLLALATDGLQAAFFEAAPSSSRTTPMSTTTGSRKENPRLSPQATSSALRPS
jgi:hypothetical protein